MAELHELIEQEFHKPNFLIQTDDSADGEKTAVIYCSSNGVYRESTVECFTKSIIETNNFEWYMTRFPNAQKHIFIRDITKRFYQFGINDNGLDSMEKIAEMIKKETAGYKIITIGSSCGGLAAVVLGKMLNADYTVAFSPILKSYKPDTPQDIIEQKLKTKEFFDYVDYADSDIPIFFIYPNGSDWDIYNSSLVKDFRNVRFLPVKSDVHGVPLNKRILRKILQSDKETLKKVINYTTADSVSEYQFAKHIGGFGFYLLRVLDFIKKYPLFLLKKEFYNLILK